MESNWTPIGPFPTIGPIMDRSWWTIEVLPAETADDPRGRAAAGAIRVLGFAGPVIRVADLYFIACGTGSFPGIGSGGEARGRIERAAPAIFADAVTQVFRIQGPEGPDRAIPEDRAFLSVGRWAHKVTVMKRPGVMDPVEASAAQALGDLGIPGAPIRTACRFYFRDPLLAEARAAMGTKALSNPAIEEVFWDDAPLSAPFAPGREYRFSRVEIPLEGLGDEALVQLSARLTLSLDLDELRAIRDHYRAAGRAPTDVELETIAQTWSEHCCHKTFSDPIDHVVMENGVERTERIDGLLRQTIRKATEDLARPWCLSVFEDNAGVVAFDERHGITFKVETHNHPSAIEPYGGAGTGIGGVIRDTMGTGLGAKPIVNTDVFCFGPPDLPQKDVPKGALHPLRVLRGVVSGVRDYGNRMGIPTASGALYFDERYVGNPLVFCGSIGIIPRDAIHKEVHPGDRIYVCGGRTGRDGIHGATFSSVELTHESETVSSGAVQIGNAIAEKKLLDVQLQARDRGLYRAVTDCGAGGLSSAVGEMGASTGARVHLEKVPLKYHGLSYAEIWISEAQERMVFAVPPEHAGELELLAASEDVECIDIGEFTSSGRLSLLYEGAPVADLDLQFLHRGRPRRVRRSVVLRRAFAPGIYPDVGGKPPDAGAALRRILGSPNVASKEWVVRQYDHEVQGQSVLKPFQGRHADGPGDACAFSPVFGSPKGIVVGCGMNPLFGDLDPYRMALAVIDEALRNIVAAGGDPDATAILDNFAWGNTRRPEVLGTLVEAAQGCRDGALGFGVPFISGKDSLNNEFQAGDRTVAIPPSLLISSLSVVDDVRRLISMDLKAAGSVMVLAGQTRDEMGGSHYFKVLGGSGGAVPAPEFPRSRRILQAVHRLAREGLLLAAHDLSEGGLAVAAAEMAFAGDVGLELFLVKVPRSAGLDRDDAVLFSESCTRFLLEVRPGDLEKVLGILEGLPAAEVGRTVGYKILRILGTGGGPVIAAALEDLRRAWKEPLDFH